MKKKKKNNLGNKKKFLAATSLKKEIVKIFVNLELFPPFISYVLMECSMVENNANNQR